MNNVILKNYKSKNANSVNSARIEIGIERKNDNLAELDANSKSMIVKNFIVFFFLRLFKFFLDCIIF